MLYMCLEGKFALQTVTQIISATADLLNLWALLKRSFVIHHTSSVLRTFSCATAGQPKWPQNMMLVIEA